MKFNDNFLKIDFYRVFFQSAGDNFHNIFVKLYIPVRIRTLFQKVHSIPTGHQTRG